ncbi:MAG: MBL fold metallo-hydrolase [Candidatus Cryosericum sp.]
MEKFQEWVGETSITRMPVGPLSTNCYLVQSGTDLMLVDPGMTENRELEWVATAVESANARLRWVVCTHGHIDHVSGADAVMKRFPYATLLIDSSETALARDPDASYASQLGLRPPLLTEAVPLASKQEILVGSTSYRTAMIPGHSPGGTVLIAGDHAFVGDTLFAGGVGRAPTRDAFEQLLEGIRQTLMTLPPSTRIFPGHGEPTSIAQELRDNRWL